MTRSKAPRPWKLTRGGYFHASMLSSNWSDNRMNPIYIARAWAFYAHSKIAGRYYHEISSPIGATADRYRKLYPEEYDLWYARHVLDLNEFEKTLY